MLVAAVYMGLGALAAGVAAAAPVDGLTWPKTSSSYVGRYLP